jgi:hypothetical protein
MRELPEVPERSFRDWWAERDAVDGAARGAARPDAAAPTS